MTDSTDDFHYAQDYSLAPLEDDCKLLGSLLDDCLKNEVGEELFNKVERIRGLAQCAAFLANKHDNGASRVLSQRMADELMKMPLEEALPLTRALGHYLSLTGIAELHHRVRRARATEKNPKSCDEVFERLIAEGMDPDEVFKSASTQVVEIVLTAHPTQVYRRTVQYKHTKIAALLQQKDRADLTSEERELIIQDLVREITGLWQTDEIRRKKPTPVDEARGGLHIVEQSLWAAVPAFLRRMSTALKKHTGRDLPLNATPLKFSSWMGGDRDGNPNVTAKITTHVVALGRWMAADMYLREIDALRFELSMNQCSDHVWRIAMELMELEEGADVQKEGARRSKPSAPVARMPSTLGHTLPSGTGGGPESNLRAVLERHSYIPDVPSEFPGQDPEGGSECEFPNDLASDVADSASESRRESNTGSFGNSLPSMNARGGSNDNLEALLLRESSRRNVTFDTAVSNELLEPLLSVSGRRKSFRTTEEAMQNLRKHLHAGMHPYRVLMAEVRRRLVNTRQHMEELLGGREPADRDPSDWFQTEEEFVQPLLAIYWSLWECGGGMIADGKLLDLIRRVYVFGMSLMKLDIRQESTRHAEALDAVTTYLGYGSYISWTEEEKCKWLTDELQTKRPLIPADTPMTPDVREVIDTFRIVAKLGKDSLGAYVISMAQKASDVLAVELLQKEARLQVAGESGVLPNHTNSLRVVPLFETLNDLECGPSVMKQLFENVWYREHLQTIHSNEQEIMLGYSDSGKDAGRLAANWALYTCQESMVQVCKAAGVKVTLFHGRGGTVGRGGGPTYLAIQSQAPGSVEGSFRITEQGEMVTAKFGIPIVAQNQLEIYTTAVLQATLRPPKDARLGQWRTLMEEMSKVSCDAYRAVVFQTPKFITYFKSATPEEELGNLNIGSRPSRRRKDPSVKNLRAIPWIFAWTQTRLILPSWLGVGAALAKQIEAGHLGELQRMYAEWPFFQASIDLMEMILAKCDMRIAALYDDVLVTDPEEKALGAELRLMYAETVKAILDVTEQHRLLQHNVALRRLIEMRNPYVDPLNILQTEVLRRTRQDPNNSRLRDALLMTINGIAAGMRNTG